MDITIRHKRHYVTVTEDDWRKSVNCSTTYPITIAVQREFGDVCNYSVSKNGFRRYHKNGKAFLPGKYLILIEDIKRHE
jgi:hypothetical protein